MKNKKFSIIIAILAAVTLTVFGCGKEKETPEEPVNSTYKSLVVAGNQWNELHINVSLSPQYQYAHTYITKIGNDYVD